jgi:gliding motility-associated-like protein
MTLLNRLSLVLLLLLFVKFSLAQKYNYNWYFGAKAAMQFSGTPLTPKPVSNSAMSTYATISLSDNITGELLFYTTGEKIWNKNHQLMPNGTQLQPNLVMYNILEVPKPGNPNQYYIFSINFKSELWYSVVDMSLDGGLGDITSEKSIMVSLNISGAITAVKKYDGSGYWLITKDDDPSGPPNNKFRVYDITKDGINLNFKEISVGEPGEWLGNLKSNSTGTTLVLTEATETTAKTQVFSFDKQTGILNNPITLHKENNWDNAFGAAFSPDDTRLYITYSGVHSNKDSSYIVQYSGTNFSNWSIVARAHKDFKRFNDLQLGPDGRLYIDNKTTLSTVKSTTLDVIENPDNPPTSVNYVEDFIDFGGSKYINARLPSFINDKSKICKLPDSLKISYSNTCVDTYTAFEFSGNNELADSVIWKFVDANSSDSLSKDFNAKHLFTQQGKYKVLLDFYVCGNKKTFTDSVEIIENKVSLGDDTAFCYKGSLNLQPNKNGLKYLWSTGDTTKTITVNKKGAYWITITTPTCDATDSIFVSERPPILINLGDDFTICEHDTDDLVKLDAGKGYSKYKWTPTQDTTQWIIVKQAGDYYVVVEDYRGCKGDDGSKVLRLCNFDFHLPNAFTPNNDGLNDVFKATALDILDLEFEIFNSWGERVFMTNNPQQGWDGTYKGKPCPEGVYLYRISFNGFSNKQLKTYNFKGNVSLLR